MEVAIFIPYLLKEKERHNGQVKPAARAVGIDAQSFDNYISGVTKELRGKNEKILCAYFHIPQSRPDLPATPDAEYWKDKFINCYENLDKALKEISNLRDEITELRERVDRLTAPPTSAGDSGAA